jgi:hypothetical protein
MIMYSEQLTMLTFNLFFQHNLQKPKKVYTYRIENNVLIFY